MLDIEDVRRRLSQITYRPGWTFTVYQGAYEHTVLAIEAEVENSYAPGTLVELRVNCPLPMPALVTVADFDRWLFWRLRSIETHECAEWLHGPDGEPLFDPHRPHADRDLPVDQPIPERGQRDGAPLRSVSTSA